MDLPKGFSFQGGAELARFDELNDWERAELYRQGEKLDPELWAKVYPKNYRPSYKAHLYPSPKCVSRTMMNIVHKVECGYHGESEMHELMWASRMVQSHVPVYWLDPALAQAIMQTKPPLELDWYNMHFPHDAMALILPNNLITHETEGNIEFVAFSRTRAGEYFPNLSRQGPALELASGNGAFTYLCRSMVGYITHWVLPYDEYPKINLTELDSIVHGYDALEFQSAWLNRVRTSPEDTRIAAIIANLIFGTLMLMLRKPELITRDSVIRSKIPPKKGEVRSEFWSPAVIGQNYRIRYERDKVDPGVKGTHASPMPHWVRGFWKDQRYGHELSLVKEIWIEPYWRGGDTAPTFD
jgi:hypothetical protein